ncbi:MAG: MmgE/PrpD family protein [Deltaproteobacteria bacterium]|nr:MmgE/PrpD family protein [Deltaproteobacteria bacterium]
MTAIVSAYELSNRFSDAMGDAVTILGLGWTHEIRAPYIMALAVGCLLGLSEEQMAHALAVAGCFTVELGILDVGEEELTMSRNLKFPYGAYSGILGALLAQKGFKGPLNVFEGHHGFAEVVARGKIDLGKLTQRRKDWTILNTWIKNFAANGQTQGFIAATITLVKEHDIKPEDVAEITIKSNSVVGWHMSDAATHKYPKNVETAGHSAYYLAAIAFLDRAVEPEQFSDQKLRDPKVRELIDKVSIEPARQLDKYSSPGIVEIITKKGQKYRCEVLQPKGHPMNPMSDADVERKFRSMAGKFMGEKQMRQIIDTVYNLEKLDDIGELIKLLVAPGQISQKL